MHAQMKGTMRLFGYLTKFLKNNIGCVDVVIADNSFLLKTVKKYLIQFKMSKILLTEPSGIVQGEQETFFRT